MPEQYTIEEFGKRIKAKYPQYARFSDTDIAQKVLVKYPQYKSSIRQAAPQVSPQAQAEIKKAQARGIPTIGAAPYQPISERKVPDASTGRPWQRFERKAESFAQKYAAPAAPYVAATVAAPWGGALLAPLGGLAAFGGATTAAGVGGFAGAKAQGESTEDAEWEALKQAGYEAGGRVISGLAGLAARPAVKKLAPWIAAKFPKAAEALAPTYTHPAEKIGGETFPMTRGQMAKGPGSISGQVEHYTQGTFLGKPLRKVIAAQEDASRKVLAKLSKVDTAVPANIAGNWSQAVQVTRGMADPMYDSLRDVSAQKAATTAQDILADDTLSHSLPSKARRALTVLGGGTREQQAAESLGFKSPEEAIRRNGQKVFDMALKEVGGGSAPTVGDAIQARHALFDLAHHSSDANIRRLAGEGADSLNSAIDASLTPEQQAIKKRADLLWRRSYIMQDVSDVLQKMVEKQPSNAAPKIEPQAFLQMVNDLAKKDYYREGGKIIEKPTQLDMLFDKPADQKAMVDLANFMATKYKGLAGNSTMGESMGRIGIVSRAVEMGVAAPSIILGATGHVPAGGELLAGLYVMVQALAHPGGPELVMKYLNAAPAQAGPIVLRLISLSQDVPAKTSQMQQLEQTRAQQNQANEQPQPTE